MSLSPAWIAAQEFVPTRVLWKQAAALERPRKVILLLPLLSAPTSSASQFARLPNWLLCDSRHLDKIPGSDKSLPSNANRGGNLLFLVSCVFFFFFFQAVYLPWPQPNFPRKQGGKGVIHHLPPA